MNCPRCDNELDEEGTIQHCYKCSYSNDLVNPLRTKQEQKKIDELIKKQLLAEVAKIFEKEGKAKDTRVTKTPMEREKYRERDREYKRNWARENKDKINKSRRNRQAKLIAEVAQSNYN